MKYIIEDGKRKAKDIKIAYVGGGSRGWAWGFMSDLLLYEDISGTVSLYDIDRASAENNMVIGNKYNAVDGAKTHWEYTVADSLASALKGADFVIISILPGTFKEMKSDLEEPEKYGIYQSVGDTVGVGGIIRALRTAPMMEEIAYAVKENCPNAWVINYTNPMTLCVKTLFRAFPQIKAFGCCHEVFGTQNFLSSVLEEELGIKGVKREEIKVNVIGVNHFTWLTSATYQDIDIYPVYEKFVEKHYQTGYETDKLDNWLNKFWKHAERVKMDLFKRYGVIAAAGDRHLAEFCPGSWYLKDRETVDEWMFALTGIEWREKDLEKRIQKGKDLAEGRLEPKIEPTGEDGVMQIRSLLGLSEMITNVNVPNVGQIPNLPMGAVVETNATFRLNEVRPVLAGEIPKQLHSLISHIATEQEALDQAISKRDLEQAFNVFVTDQQVSISLKEARKLFDAMVENTKEYLKDYLK
jgi:alpha-galactosidase